MKGGFNHPLLLSFTPGEKQYGDRIRWCSETATILSATELGAFDLLSAAPFFPQVTTGYDLVPIFKDAFGTSRLAAGRKLVLDLQSCEGRGGEEPNRAPRVPL